jgi:hypothetical protein
LYNDFDESRVWLLPGKPSRSHWDFAENKIRIRYVQTHQRLIVAPWVFLQLCGWWTERMKVGDVRKEGSEVEL